MSGIKYTVLDSSNIAESYPGITLPLTFSFIKTAYGGVFKGVIGANLKNDAILSKFENIFDNMIKSYNGRVYYCINNWYSIIDFLPFSKRITPVWQDMMGVLNTDVYLGRQHKFTVFQKLKLHSNLIKSWFSSPRDMKRLEEDFLGVREYFNGVYSESLTVNELLTLFHEIEKRVLNKWFVTLTNDMYAFIWTGLLKKRLKKKGADITEFISGMSSLESLKPIRTLLYLSEKYGDCGDILSEPEVREYIELYGDRCPGELKLETVTYRENPTLLESRIRDYSSDKAKLDCMKKNLDRQAENGSKYGFAAKRARTGIMNREISRLNRSRIYGMVRRIFLRIGELFSGENIISKAEDIFYLSIDEISCCDYSAFKPKITERKRLYAGYENLPAHSRLMFRGNDLEDGLPPADIKTAELWKDGFDGTGTSDGIVTAKAVVLEAPDEKADVKGKIIVTKTTDPGWVFLLAAASGIVAEKGSLLSHTAIISRELNIPAVVAVDSAASVIKTGDTLRINGKTGRVEIVESD